MSTERSETPAVTHPPVEVVSLRAAAAASPDRPAPRAASPGVGGGGGGGGIDSDWERYLGAVRRRKWLVLAFTAVGTLLGVLGSRLLRPEYSATALLWFEAQDRSRDPRATEPDELLNPSGWVDLVESNAVLEDVVRERRLYLQPRSPNDSSALTTLQLNGPVIPGSYRYAVDRSGAAFTLSTRTGPVLQQGAVSEPVGAGLGFAWTPPREVLRPGATIEFDLATPAGAARELAKDLKVSTDVDPPLARSSVDANFLRLEFQGSVPADVATTVNAIAERVVAVAADLKRMRLVELARILDEQRQHAESSLAAAEVALRDFRTHAAGVLRDEAPPVSPALRNGGDPVFASSFDAKLALDSVQRDRQALQQALAHAADSGFSVEAVQAIGAVQKSAELSLALQELTRKQADLRALRYRYTDASDPVQRVKSDVATLERQTVPALARALVAELAARERQLGQRTDSAFGYVRQLPPLALREARLQRDVTIAEQLFTTVQQRLDQTRLAVVSTLPDVRILDRAAVPERPDRNMAPFFGCLAFVTSLGLAVVGVVTFDRMDPKVRYPEHVTGQMRLPILGAVPHVDWRHSANGDQAAPVVEALRGLRLRLVHATGPGAPLLVTVSSPGAGEGKSFLTCNLALAFADAGYRTLLIDGDIRRGVQHRMLGLQREPGLVDFLAGELPLESVLQGTRYPGLSFMGFGSRRPRAPELLSSAPMSDLMARLRTDFAVVLVDSPPLAAGVDPCVLATVTGSLMLVLRAGVTDLELAAAKLELLESLPVRVMGAVLNDVRPNGVYRYYTYDVTAYGKARTDGDSGGRASPTKVLWGRT